MKKSPLDSLLRFWPILLSVIGLVGFCYTLNTRMASAEEKDKQQDLFLTNQYVYNQDSKVAQARIEEQTRATYQLLQDMRADLKESQRHGR